MVYCGGNILWGYLLVKSPLSALRLVGGIFGLLGAVFAAVALVFFFLVPPALTSSPLFLLTFGLTFGILGLVFLGVGIPLFVIGSRNSERRALRLMDTGERYNAEITGIEQAGYAVNNRRPWRVLCRYTDESGREWSCRSAPLWEKPALSGAPAVVYRHARKPRSYYVDLSDAVEGSVGF